VKKLKRFLLYNFLLLSSCSYRWDLNYPQAKRPTITIPFIQGDEEGMLTAEITNAIASSRIADVVAKGGDYTLKVQIIRSDAEIIGYRINPQKIKGEIKENLLATEGRKIIGVEAGLYQGDDLVYGPYKIAATADYDYIDGDSVEDLTFVNREGEMVIALPFSLGQLEPYEAALEAAARPVRVRLAQKIVDAISAEW
jgi:hypothetical protein